MALRKQPITIAASQIDSALTDFPVLITRAHLDDEVVDPSGGNAAQTDGGDLKFYSDEALSSRLSCEVVQFEHDSVSAADDAEIQVWVKVPSISATVDTVIWVSYNETDSQPATGAAFGRDDVWSNNFAAVYHCEEASGDLVDSTGNGNTQVASNTPQYSVAGQIGDGVGSVTSASEYFSAPAAVTGAPFTLESWVNSSGDSIHHSINDASSSNTQWTTQRFSGNFYFQVRSGGSFQNAATSNSFSAGWNYTVSRTSASNSREAILNADFANEGTNTNTIEPTGIDTFDLFRFGDSSPQYSGDPQADEVRLSSVARADEWISATYRNANAPATFATAGTPENAAGGGSSVVAEAGSYTLTGSDASLLKGSVTPADAGIYSVSGSPANLLKGHTLVAESGSYTLTGQDAALTKDWRVSAEAGSYTLSGSAASLEKGWELAAEAGLYTLTGSDATLTDSGEDPTLTAESGEYTLTGQAATLTKQWIVSANAGSYSLSGSPATLVRNVPLSAEAGSYNLSGQSAALKKGSVLAAAAGSYTLTGSDAALDWSGEEQIPAVIITDVSISIPAANNVSVAKPAAIDVQFLG